MRDQSRISALLRYRLHGMETIARLADTVDELQMGNVHAQNERANQPEIHRRHQPSAGRCNFVIAPLFLGSLTEQRKNPRERGEEQNPDNEVWMKPGKPAKGRESG